MSRIMLVDDDVTLKMGLEEYLTSMGHDVIGQADSGEQAVEMARTLKPDLIMMDVVMPGEMDGIAAAEIIKQELDVAIIFISGYSNREYIEKAKAIEPFGYVMKPFDETEVRVLVEIALHKRKMELKLKDAYNRLQKNERMLNAIIDKSPIPTAVAGSDGSIWSFNGALTQLTGYTKNEIANLDEWARRLYPDRSYRDFAWKNIQQALKGGTAEETEFIITRKDGEKRNALFQRAFFEEGLIIQIVDITERVRAEKELQESENRFHALFENISDGIYVHDTEGRILDANHVACERLGYTREEILGLSVADVDLNYPTVEELQEKIVPIVKSGPLTMESRHITKDRKIIHVELQISMFDHDGEELFVAIARDITERKIAERALKEQKVFVEELLETIPSPIFYKNRDGLYTGCNLAFEKFIGRSRQEIIGKTVFDVTIKELAQRFRESDDELFRNQGKHRYESQVSVKNGMRQIIFDKAVIPGPDGQPQGIIGVITDITEHQQMEQTLRESEEKLRVIFDTVYCGMILVDAAGTIIFVNHRMAEMFGQDIQKLIGSSYPEHVHETQYNEGEDKMFRLIQGEIDHVSLKRLYKRKDGTTFWGHLSGRRLLHPDGTFASLVGAIYDLTENKEGSEGTS